jgi:membrane associated rhomboid family serine protease
MRIDTRYRSSASLFLPSFLPGVKWLVTANVVIYVIQVLSVDARVLGRTLLDIFNLMPYDVLRGAIWQLVSYMFLHGGLGHILFNMLALWMFGGSVEETWGTRRFLQYYFICGVGAGVCVVIANRLFGNIHQPTIGASGAIYGVLLAFAMLFPEAEILIMFLFPVKAKYAVMIFGAIALLLSIQGGGTVSNFAHLGGLLVGYIYFRTQFSPRRRPRLAGAPSFSVGGWWREYKMQRAKKKFQVYMKKHGSDKGPWVN